MYQIIKTREEMKLIKEKDKHWEFINVKFAIKSGDSIQILDASKFKLTEKNMNLSTNEKFKKFGIGSFKVKLTGYYKNDFLIYYITSYQEKGGKNDKEFRLLSRDWNTSH